MRIIQVTIFTLAFSLLLTCCERVVLTASDEQIMISHLETLREVNVEMVAENRLALLRIKSNVFGNGRRTEDLKMYNTLVKIDSASKALIQYMNSVGGSYSEEISNAMTIKPDIDQRLGKDMKIKLNEFSLLCDQFSEREDFEYIALDGIGIDDLRSSEFVYDTFEELYYEPATVYDLLLALEIHKNEVLDYQYRTLYLGAVGSSDIAFDRIELAVVADHRIQAVRINEKKYLARFKGMAFLTIVEAFPELPIPHSLNVDGNSYEVDWYDSLQIPADPLDKIGLNLTTYYGKDTIVMVNNLIQPW